MLGHRPDPLRNDDFFTTSRRLRDLNPICFLPSSRRAHRCLVQLGSRSRAEQFKPRFVFKDRFAISNGTSLNVER